MRFCFEIGESEKSTVEFEFSQLLGRTIIRVNGREVRRTCRYFSEPIFDEHEFSVGDKEKYVVRIEKRRRLLFTSKYRVLINRRLLEVRHGR